MTWNDEQSLLVFCTAVERLFMKTFIALCLGASNPQKDEDSVTDLGLTCFYGHLEVSVKTYPWKLTEPIYNTKTWTDEPRNKTWECDAA